MQSFSLYCTCEHPKIEIILGEVVEYRGFLLLEFLPSGHLGLGCLLPDQKRSIKLYRRRNGISAYQGCSSGSNPNDSICCDPQYA